MESNWTVTLTRKVTIMTKREGRTKRDADRKRRRARAEAMEPCGGVEQMEPRLLMSAGWQMMVARPAFHMAAASSSQKVAVERPLAAGQNQEPGAAVDDPDPAEFERPLAALELIGRNGISRGAPSNDTDFLNAGKGDGSAGGNEGTYGKSSSPNSLVPDSPWSEYEPEGFSGRPTGEALKDMADNRYGGMLGDNLGTGPGALDDSALEGGPGLTLDRGTGGNPAKGDVDTGYQGADSRQMSGGTTTDAKPAPKPEPKPEDPKPEDPKPEDPKPEDPKDTEDKKKEINSGPQADGSIVRASNTPPRQRSMARKAAGWVWSWVAPPWKSGTTNAAVGVRGTPHPDSDDNGPQRGKKRAMIRFGHPYSPNRVVLGADSLMDPGDPDSGLTGTRRFDPSRVSAKGALAERINPYIQNTSEDGAADSDKNWIVGRNAQPRVDLVEAHKGDTRPGLENRTGTTADTGVPGSRIARAFAKIASRFSSKVDTAPGSGNSTGIATDTGARSSGSSGLFSGRSSRASSTSKRTTGTHGSSRLGSSALIRSSSATSARSSGTGGSSSKLPSLGR